MVAAELMDIAARALDGMRAQGFEHAQVRVALGRQDELNIGHNTPTLMRSSETHKLTLLGILDGRKASTEVTDVDEGIARAALVRLFNDARSAPQDDANAVSAGQQVELVQGPQAADFAALAEVASDLLVFRARETPKVVLDETSVSHRLLQSYTVTSSGSALGLSVGNYGMVVCCAAREGVRASSFNMASGTTDDLRTRPVERFFGIEQMLRDSERQIDTTGIGASFVGDAVLAPAAVVPLVAWLQAQIGDQQLIAGTSLYRRRVGSAIATPKFTLKSRFDAPGVAAVSADAFGTAPVTVIDKGVLRTLTPTFYGSRRTGLPHVPVAESGWEMAEGDTPLAELMSEVKRGAVIGRLSMGNPASNGDFAGVIKNSFEIRDGWVGRALAEVMVAGNVASMLFDVAAVSRERIDYGLLCLPWLRVPNLHFSYCRTDTAPRRRESADR